MYETFGVVICVYNEEQTIGFVLLSVVQAVGPERVVVVDDGSSDRSAEIAASFGVHVIRNPTNIGKGQSMLKGTQFFISADAVLYLDSDLLGLKPDHVLKLISMYLRNSRYGQVVGNRDWLGPLSELQGIIPDQISGERIVSMDVLSTVPPDCWKGYRIEVAINHVTSSAGLETGSYVMKGVTAKQKEEKNGLILGSKKNEKMYRGVFAAKRSLKMCGNCSCSGNTILDVGQAGVYSGISTIRAIGQAIKGSLKDI